MCVEANDSKGRGSDSGSRRISNATAFDFTSERGGHIDRERTSKRTASRANTCNQIENSKGVDGA